MAALPIIFRESWPLFAVVAGMIVTGTVGVILAIREYRENVRVLASIGAVK